MNNRMASYFLLRVLLCVVLNFASTAIGVLHLRQKEQTNKQKPSAFHRSIGCIWCKFYPLLCTDGKHLLIHRTCCLLLLVGGRLRLGALGSMFVDAVVQQNSSHNSHNEGYYCRSCNCHPHSRQAVSDSMCTI